METLTATTAAPNLKDAYTAIPVETTVKATEGKVATVYYAKEQLVRQYAYNTKTYEIGEEIGGHWTEKGLAQVDGYGLMEADIIPWEKIITRKFITVREYKTTTWEIVDK